MHIIHSTATSLFSFACASCVMDPIRPVAVACNIYEQQSGNYIQDIDDGGLILAPANDEQSQQFDFGLDSLVY